MGKKIIFGDIDKPSYEWITVDCNRSADVVLYFKNGSRLPFDDLSIDFIYTSHTIEHLFEEDVQALFSEFYRVLKYGGGMRIVAPNAEYYINSYLNDENKDAFFVDEFYPNTGETYYDVNKSFKTKYGLDMCLLEPHNLLCSVFCSYNNRVPLRISSKMRSSTLNLF